MRSWFSQEWSLEQPSELALLIPNFLVFIELDIKLSFVIRWQSLILILVKVYIIGWFGLERWVKWSLNDFPHSLEWLSSPVCIVSSIWGRTYEYWADWAWLSLGLLLNLLYCKWLEISLLGGEIVKGRIKLNLNVSLFIINNELRLLSMTTGYQVLLGLEIFLVQSVHWSRVLVW